MALHSVAHCVVSILRLVGMEEKEIHVSLKAC